MRSRDLELRLAEELVAAAVLEAHERPQQHADGRRREPADALELLLAGVRFEEREQGAQVGQVEQRQPLRVGVVEHEREALLLGVVGLEHLAEQLRPEVGHRRPHRHARADAAEREVLDRGSGRRERQAQRRHALLGRAAWRARGADAGEVALHVRGEHRHSRGRELLGHGLQRDRLAGAGRARHEPVAVHHPERDLDHRLGRELAVVHATAEVDRRPSVA